MPRSRPCLQALAASRATGDLAVLAEGLSLTHHALLAPEHLDARQLLADELIEVSGRIGDDLRLLFGLLWRTVDLFLAGDESATRDLAELRTRADAVGCRSIGYIASAIDVMQLMRDGRLDEAEAAAHAAFEQGVDVGDADATGYYGAHLLTIRWFQDRDGELTDLARDIATSSMLVVPEFAYRAAAATIAARAGRTDQAATLLSPLRRVGLADAPTVEHVAERDRQRRRGCRDHRRHRDWPSRRIHCSSRSQRVPSCRRWRSAASDRSSGPSDWRRRPAPTATERSSTCGGRWPPTSGSATAR